MRKLLRQTLAKCLDGPMDRTYYVDKNNYHFEIASKGENLSLNIYNDFGFGGSHFYGLLQKNVVFEKKRKLSTAFSPNVF